MGGGGEDDTGGTTGDGGAPKVPEPAFISPAEGEFQVDSVRHRALDIVVQAITLGNTQVLIDGQSVGDLGADSTIGALTADRLQIDLHGALAVGVHTLRLASSGKDGPLFSAELTMQIEAPTLQPPTFRAVLVPDPIAPANALATGPGRVLAALAAGPDPVLRVFLPDGDAWAATAAAEVPLEGHVLESMAFGPSFAAQATSAGLRVAHRRGLPGDAVVTREVTHEGLGAPQVALDLDAALFAGAEVASLGAPALARDALLVEFTAAADAEVAHPGDRGLAHLRRRDGGWTAARRVATAEPTDLDGLGPLLRLSDLDGDRRPALAVRVGRRLPGVVALADAGGVQVEVGPPDLGLALDDPGRVAILASDFGAHAAMGVAPAVLRIALYGTAGTPQNVVRGPKGTKLPDAALTAPPTPGVVLGYSTFLIPFGDAAPVHVLFADGSDLRGAPLDQPTPVHCSAVALFPGLGGNDDSDPALTFACLHQGTLRFGLLTAGQG